MIRGFQIIDNLSYVCISHKQQVWLVTVGPMKLLNLMTIGLYFHSSRGLCEEFSNLKNISQDATSDQLTDELGLVHGRWIEHWVQHILVYPCFI